MKHKKVLKKGDHIFWNTSQGKTRGVILKKITTKTKIKGFTAKPTKDHSEYLVKSDKIGKKAIHTEKGLSK